MRTVERGDWSPVRYVKPNPARSWIGGYEAYNEDGTYLTLDLDGRVSISFGYDAGDAPAWLVRELLDAAEKP